MKALLVALLCAAGLFAQATLPPAPGSLTGWAWYNQGPSTVDASTGAFVLTVQSVPGNLAQFTSMLTKPVSGTFSVIAAVGGASASNNFYDLPVGIVFLETSTGHFTTCQWETDPYGWFYSATYWTSATANPANGSDRMIDAYRQRSGTSLGLIRAGDDGTNRTCDVSLDGVHWLNYYTEGHTVNMTADRVGFFVSTLQGTAPSATAQGILFGWSGL